MTLTTTTTTATLSDDSVRASVSLLGYTSEGRQRWLWEVTYTSQTASGDDLLTGVGFDSAPEDMLRTLASFLSAHSEASEGGENADLFTLTADASGEIAEAIYCAVGWED